MIKTYELSGDELLGFVKKAIDPDTDTDPLSLVEKYNISIDKLRG